MGKLHGCQAGGNDGIPGCEWFNESLFGFQEDTPLTNNNFYRRLLSQQGYHGKSATQVLLFKSV